MEEVERAMEKLGEEIKKAFQDTRNLKDLPKTY